MSNGVKGKVQELDLKTGKITVKDYTGNLGQSNIVANADVNMEEVATLITYAKGQGWI